MTRNYMKHTVDPHLSGLLVFGRSNYPDWVVTVQLKCFVGSVQYLSVFLNNNYYKYMHGFNY